jgi:hypothetical protein
MSRTEVLDLLSGYRAGGAGDDVIDSLELAWLLHQVEQRYGVRLELTDEQLASMSTVDGAALVLDDALGRPAVGRP